MQGKVSYILNSITHFFTGHHGTGRKVMIARSAVIFDANEYRHTQLQNSLIVTA